MKTISFDRAAEFYSLTRAHPAHVSRRLVESLAEFLSPGAPVLEIGIGTGRIACPLMKHGLQVTGIDLSVKMMNKLRACLPPGSLPPALIKGNAAALPLASQYFTAVLAVHVLHLIEPWQVALSEARRVLQPGGSLFIGYDWYNPASAHGLVREKWRRLVLEETGEGDTPQPQKFELHEAYLAGTGASCRHWEAATWTTSFHPQSYLQSLRDGVYSSSWVLPPDRLACAMEALRTWILTEVGDLDQEYPVSRKFIWQQYSWG